MRIFLLSLLYFGSMHASEHPYRKLKNPPIPLEESIKVYVSTPPRTGSTLIFNISQYLFEDQVFATNDGRVIKTHFNYHSLFNTELKKDTDIFILTVRDPLELNASLQSAMPCAKIWADPTWILTPEVFEKSPNKIVLRFECFKNNKFHYMLELFEHSLNITIPEHIKEEMKRLFNTDAMKVISDSKNGFGEWDKLTGIHGNHLTNADWIKKYSYREAKAIYEKTYALRKSWGYPDLDLEAIYDR